MYTRVLKWFPYLHTNTHQTPPCTCYDYPHNLPIGVDLRVPLHSLLMLLDISHNRDYFFFPHDDKRLRSRQQHSARRIFLWNSLRICLVICKSLFIELKVDEKFRKVSMNTESYRTLFLQYGERCVRVPTQWSIHKSMNTIWLCVPVLIV